MLWILANQGLQHLIKGNLSHKFVPKTVNPVIIVCRNSIRGWWRNHICCSNVQTQHFTRLRVVRLYRSVIEKMDLYIYICVCVRCQGKDRLDTEEGFICPGVSSRRRLILGGELQLTGVTPALVGQRSAAQSALTVHVYRYHLYKMLI